MHDVIEKPRPLSRLTLNPVTATEKTPMPTPQMATMTSEIPPATAARVERAKLFRSVGFLQTCVIVLGLALVCVGTVAWFEHETLGHQGTQIGQLQEQTKYQQQQINQLKGAR